MTTTITLSQLQADYRAAAARLQNARAEKAQWIVEKGDTRAVRREARERFDAALEAALSAERAAGDALLEHGREIALKHGRMGAVEAHDAALHPIDADRMKLRDLALKLALAL